MTSTAEVFARDGVVLLKNVIDRSWIDPLLDLADRELRDPGPWVTDSNPGASADRLFTTRYLWPTDELIRSFAFESGMAGIVGDVLDSDSVRLYFDHLLVKEPNTRAPTPWHQDIPYWPFLGSKIASAWVSLTDADVEGSSLEFVRGSHEWGTYYAPESFSDKSDTAWTTEFVGERIPDIESARDDYDIVGFDVEAGDAIIFSAWMVHGSPPNSAPRRRVALSTRWLGDDSTWYPHAGCDPTVTDEQVCIAPGEYPADDTNFPVGWQR